MTSVERWASAPPELSDESYNRLYERSKQLAKAEFLPKTLKGKPDNIMAIALTAHDLGMPLTLTTLGKFHVIEGRVEPSAQLMLGVAASRGHDIWIDYADNDRALVKGRRAGNDRVDSFEFTMERARTAGLLDSWVEHWVEGSGRRKYVLGSTAEPPAWAKKLIDAGAVKRNQAWHTYPIEMLTNAAIRRACRAICPDVLLGLPATSYDFAGPTEPETSSGGVHGASESASQADRMPPAAPAGVTPDDEDIAEAELVDDDDLVDDAWRQSFAIACTGAGLGADERHAIIDAATSGRTRTSKGLRRSEVGEVRRWFRSVIEGDPPPYRFLELDGAIVIAPRNAETPGEAA